MSLGSSPMGRRQRLAAELCTLRTGACMSSVELSDRLGWPETKVRRLESGRIRPDVGDVIDVLDALGVTGHQRDRIIDLTHDAAASSWWNAYDTIAEDRQRAHAQLENGALAIWEFQITLFPGLLQCPEYARARFMSRPSAGLSPIDVDKAVGARLDRQEIFTRETPFTYEAILDEAIIVRRCGPLGTRTAQLSHLIRLAQLPAVTVRILPYDAEITGDYLPQCAFSYYDRADPVDSELIALETHTSTLVLGDRQDVDLYKGLYKRLRDASLSPDDTLSLLAAARDNPEELP